MLSGYRTGSACSSSPRRVVPVSAARLIFSKRAFMPNGRGFPFGRWFEPRQTRHLTCWLFEQGLTRRVAR